MLDTELLAHAAQALHGTEWRRPLADGLGVNLRTVQRWANGQNAIPADVWATLSTLLCSHAARASALAADCVRAATSTSEE